MSMLRQVVAISVLGIRTLPQRKGTASVVVVGVACVVAVLVSMLSVTTGLARAYVSGGNPALAIVIPKNEEGESGADLSPAIVGTILNAPGIARGPNGAAFADAEFRMVFLPPPGFPADSLQVRAMGLTGAALRDGFKIEAGRMFRTGAQEVIVGAGAARMFNMHVGEKVLMPSGHWPIVGVFSNGGDKLEGQLITDAQTLMSAARRPGFGSVIVKLDRAESFPAFQHWLTTNPGLSVKAMRMTEFLEQADGPQMKFFARSTYAIGLIMALGALFGAVKIMYAAVRARTREIGTLRALGFGSVPVAISVLIEAVVLSLAGAALGVLIAWLLFDEREVYSTGIFRLQVSLQLVALGLAWGIVIALLGGVFPALRAGRIPAADALRAV
jgi:putative ABC transport system permease protein